MAKQLVTAPAAEPVSLAEAQAHCNVDHSADDTYLNALITVARETVENWTNRALVSQTWKAYYPKFGVLILPKPKAISVTHVKWYDTTDTAQTIAASIWDADLVSEPAYITLAYQQQWPVIVARTTLPIEVQFVCGYADAASVPNSIKQAMLLLIGHWYRNRENVIITDRGMASSAIIELGAYRLLDNYTVKGTE